jgi:antitoxin ParD1/3/4
MEIRLSPELEALVTKDLARGRFASVEEYVAEAVELLHEREQWLSETLEEQRESLDLAWQEAERGELMPVEDFREEMRTMKTAWAERQRGS